LRGNQVRYLANSHSPNFAVRDFDGDQKPDLVLIHVLRDGAKSSRYSIDFQLSSGPTPTIGIIAPTGGLQLTPSDVNGDDVVDLIVTSPFDSGFVAILVNDGRGNFREVDPENYLSAATAIEHGFVTDLRIPENYPSFQQNRYRSGFSDLAITALPCVLVSAKLQNRAWNSISSAQVLHQSGRAPPVFLPL